MAALSRLALLITELAEGGPLAFNPEVNMRSFFSVAPGVIWAALIVGLMLLADWLSTYLGGVAWVAPVAGFLAAVLVPVLRIIAQGETPAGRGEVSVYRSRLSRWLW